MRTIAVSASGAPVGVVEIDTPEPAADEVLVRVHAASVNGFDLAVAAGRLEGMMEHRYPVVIGKDFAGVVESVGGDVSRFAPGDQVFGVVMKPFLGDGSFGEFVAVGSQYGIAAVPAGLELGVAGAIGLAGSAAIDTIDALALTSGDTVLVVGATGGVGALAVQYAAATGATVIATAKPGAETNFVRGLGAIEAVDYTGDVAAQVRAIAPQGVTAIAHFAGDPTAVLDLLGPGGRLASTLGFGADKDPAATAIMASPATDTLARVGADVAAGRITVPVMRTYRLDQVPAAFDDFAAGTLGKLAVSIV